MVKLPATAGLLIDLYALKNTVEGDKRSSKPSFEITPENCTNVFPITCLVR